MLIRFSVTNFRSFRDETVFEMIAGSETSHEKHLIKDLKGNRKFLRTSAVYGANGSGKSNLVLAIDFLKDLVLRGTKSGESIEVEPFLLSKATRKKPSTFEIVFSHKDSIYTYGIAMSKKEVVEEWLFASPNSREVPMFTRQTVKGKVAVDLGPSLIGRKNPGKRKQFLEFVAEGTRANQPFLTEAGERNVQEASLVLEWFRSVLQIVTAESIYQNLEISIQKNKTFTQFIGNIMASVGTGIVGVHAEALPIDFDTKFADMSEDMRNEIRGLLNDGEKVLVSTPTETLAVVPGKAQPCVLKLKTEHVGEDGDLVNFEFDQESEGTKRLLHLLPILFNSGKRGNVFVIDELDRRLHPLLSREFVKRFLDLEKSRSQLVFTTHDTNLLDGQLLRNDEIWFVEKKSNGASTLYSLSDFRLRKGLKLEKGYLMGRFGAIPPIFSAELLDSKIG